MSKAFPTLIISLLITGLCVLIAILVTAKVVTNKNEVELYALKVQQYEDCRWEATNNYTENWEQACIQTSNGCVMPSADALIRIDSGYKAALDRCTALLQ